MKNYLLVTGITALVLGCATAPPSPVTESEGAAPPTASESPTAPAPSTKISKSVETAQDPLATNQEKERPATPMAPGDTAAAQEPTPPEELAVLIVHSGALITQVNGDSTLRCMRPDCRISLPPGMHRVAVKYRDTATRGGSTVTYASMYPRIVEIDLEPGHHYSVTASGRYSHKWWISIEDQTANKTVYNDRDKPQQ